MTVKRDALSLSVTGRHIGIPSARVEGGGAARQPLHPRMFASHLPAVLLDVAAPAQCRGFVQERRTVDGEGCCHLCFFTYRSDTHVDPQ